MPEQRCLVCGTWTTKKCGQCRRAFYCSIKCQQTHWHTHKPECEKWSGLSFVGDGGGDQWNFSYLRTKVGESSRPNDRWPATFGDGSFLKWTRGTNSSILLSLYHDGGKIWLLNKGDQLKRGFVPMMETWDSGIDLFLGVNWWGVSGMHPFNLGKVAAYAKKTRAYDQDHEIRQAESYAERIAETPKDHWSYLAVLGSHLMLHAARAIQYDPRVALLESIQNALGAALFGVTRITHALRTMIRLLDRSDPILDDCKEAHVDPVSLPGKSKSDLPALMERSNAVARHLGLPQVMSEGEYLTLDTCGSLGALNLQTHAYLGNAAGRADCWSTVHDADSENRKLRSLHAIIWYSMNLRYGHHKQTISCDIQAGSKAMDRAEILSSMMSKTLNRQLPRLTETDKNMLKAPIPMIVCSTLVDVQDASGYRPSERKAVSYELLVSNPITIGLYYDIAVARSADVLLVKDAMDFFRLRHLFKTMEDVSAPDEFRIYYDDDVKGLFA
jgi:hypothetical protein